MDKQYDKRIGRTRRRLESGNTQNDTKKISTWTTSGHDGMVSGSRNSPPFTTD